MSLASSPATPASYHQWTPPAIVRALDSFKVGVWTEPTQPIAFEQNEVTVVNTVTGDSNSIHQPSAAGPAVLPGMLAVSSLPRYLHGKAPIEVPGYVTFYTKFAADFTNFVFVGDPIEVAFRPVEPRPHKLGTQLECDFRVHIVGTPEPSIIGMVGLVLMEEQKFRRMLALVQRSRRRN